MCVSGHVQDPLAESLEITEAKGISFQDFNLVVVTLSKCVCIREFKRSKDTGQPVVVSIRTPLQCRDLALF